MKYSKDINYKLNVNSLQISLSLKCSDETIGGLRVLLGYRSVGVDGSDGGSDSESDGGSTGADDGSDGGSIEVNDLGNLKGERLTEGCGSTTGASSAVADPEFSEGGFQNSAREARGETFVRPRPLPVQTGAKNEGLKMISVCL